MPTIATENLRFSNLVKSEYQATTGYCRDAVTVNEATAKEYIVGSVLGLVTATGKYKLSVQTATDGSEVAAAIVLRDVSVAATTDTKVVVLARGPAEVAKGALVLDATYNLDAEKAAVYAALEAKGIKVLNQI